MYRVTWDIDDDIIIAYRQKLARMPQLLQKAYRGEVQRVATKALAELRAQPGRPKYPIRWKTERQRRAYFATDGFGGGIPSRRSGAVSRGWQWGFTSDGNTGTVEIFNDVPYTRFVQGDDAQPFHLDTGWPQAAKIATRTEEELTDALIKTWFSIVEFDT